MKKTVASKDGGIDVPLSEKEIKARKAEEAINLADSQKNAYKDKRKKEYGSHQEQFDMIYWDRKNDTNLWEDHISDVKRKYPKA